MQKKSPRGIKKMSISCLENAHHHFNPTLSYFFIIFGKRMVQRCQILRNGEKMLNYEKQHRQEKWNVFIYFLTGTH